MILPFDYHRFRECLDFLFNDVNLLTVLAKYYDDIQVKIFSYTKTYYILIVNNKFLGSFYHETNWGKEIVSKEILIGGYYLVRMDISYLLAKILNYYDNHVIIIPYNFIDGKFVEDVRRDIINIGIISIPPLMLDKIKNKMN